MTPSWYDVLDVPPDASTDEIRTAWRAAVADLDPTDRRFAVLNRAAKVLLDPDARAAHDAELAEQDALDDDEQDDADEHDEATDAVVVAPSAPATPTEKKPAGTKPAAKKPAEKKPAEKKPAAKKAAEKKPAAKKPAAKKATEKKSGVSLAKDAGTTSTTTSTSTDAAEARSPLWVALVAGVVAVLLAALAVTALVSSTSTEELDSDVTEAQAAAEQAIVPVLSYDATDLEAGRSTALSYLTDDFGEEYAELFDGLIEGNAQDIGAQVQATLLASAVVRTDPEVQRVQVLVFVDQQTTNDELATPRTDSNQVTVTMERVGDEWLIDDLDTGAAG